MFVRKILICFTLLLLGLSTPAFSQAVNATLLGTVADPTGATVTHAKITATEMKTGVVHKSVSNESGNYTFPDLQPGIYSVTAEAPGFKKATHQNIDVQINSSTRVDLNLATGSVSETVLVTTAPPLLQTDRADISTKLEAHQVSDLPLSANRNFQSLLNLVPGTAPATYENSQFFNAAGSLQTRVNGMPRFGNLYQIEGIDDDNRTGLLQIIVPPAEAIQSVDISTSNFEAELGRATGAVTNVILKSGSNAFHGSVFEFIQNSAVNARSYFGGPLGHLSYNYFGGSIGGPIWKDKLFFFGDYLRSIDHEAISNTFTIVPPTFYTPNAAGFIDLSAPLNTAKHAGQIYDPATGNSDGTGRKPFVNNQIPFSRVNPVSLALLKLLPQPNQNQSNLASPSNNYVTNLPFTKGSDSFDVKLDYSLNERNHLSGRYSFQHVPTFQAPAFGSFAGGPAGGGFQGTGVQNAYSSGLNYDHVFSPTLFTEVRFGVAHLRNNAQPSDYGKNDATTIGVPGVNIGGQPFTSGQVGITLNGGFSNPTIGYSASMPWVRGEANIDFVNNWTKIIRNHTIKFGGDLRRVRDDLLQGESFSPRGQITFSAGQTSTNAPGAVPNVANDVASFLLDQPSKAGRDLTTIFPAYRQWWLFAFASDKWQATSKLTLDLGVRWEFYPPATPKVRGGFSNYDPTTNNLVLAGIGGNPLNVGMQTRYRYVAPRTGFAYRATDNTVIRGGFGISYSPLADDSYAFNYPVRANNSYQPNTAYTPAVLSNGQVATFQAGFPAPVPVVIPPSGIISASTPDLLSQQYNVIPKNYKNAYVESWNMAVQQALPGNFSMQLAYVANHGVDMGAQQNINLPSTYGGGTKFEPENIAFGRTASTNVIDLGFSSNYQSLQAQLSRRLSSGLSLTSAFTWGKGMDYVSGDDGGMTFFINKRRNYAPNSYDRTLNFEQSFTYALPFGRGRRWLNSGLTSVALGGWKVSGIISVVSGTPFTISADGSTLNTPGTTQTASLVGPYRVLHGIGQGKSWFDPTSFAQPTGCTVQPCTAANVGLGNTGRNQFRGPGFIQDNISLFKSFAIFREASLETRIEAKQLSNTPQFGNPNSTYSSNPTSTFGHVTSTLSSGQGSVNGIGGGRSLQASAEIRF